MTNEFEDELNRLRKVNAESLQLSKDEIEWLRENRAFIEAQRKASEHEAWLRGRIKVIWPWIITGVAALVAVIDWIYKHIRFS